MARLREDPRFRAVQPDAFDTEGDDAIAPAHDSEDDEGLELWFDWAFVDFWKNHYYTVQRSIAVDPDVVRQTNASDDGSSAEIIMNLRQKLKASSEEVVHLQTQISTQRAEHSKEKDHLVAEIQSLGEQAAKSDGSELDTLRSDLAAAKAQVSSSLAESAAHAETKAQLEAATAELEEVKAELCKLKTEAEANKDGEKLAAAEKAKEEAEAKLEKVEKEAKEKIEAAEKKAAEQKADAGKGKKGKGGDELAKLKVKVGELEKLAKEESDKAAEKEKEHEDLLVLLDELSSKRKRDKEMLKEKGVEVSEDEDEDDE